MISKTTFLLYLLVLPFVGIAAPPATLSPDDTKAFQAIATARRFCSEAIGEGGDTPTVVVAFRTLLKSPHADAAFRRLLDDATTTGKLYALCGIYYTDPAFFERAVQPFRNSEEQVPTFMGCIMSRATVGSIVQQPGAVRLKSRSQTVKQWATATKARSMSYDIVGGGWPNAFKESGGYRTQ